VIARYVLPDAALVIAAFVLSYRRQVLRQRQRGPRAVEGRYSLLRIPLTMTLDALALAIVVEVFPRYWWLGFIVWFVINGFFIALLRTRSQPRGRGTP
jgi:hypothetical protein